MSGRTSAQTIPSGPFVVGGCAQVYAQPFTLAGTPDGGGPAVYKIAWVRVRAIANPWVKLAFEGGDDAVWVNGAAIAWVRPVSDTKAAEIKYCGAK